MEIYTKENLAGLSKDALMVLYALQLATPKPKNEDEIIKIVNDCNLESRTSEELISYILGH